MTATAASDRAMSYWPTPTDLADDLVFSVIDPWHLPDGAGVRILEPSAGDGALVRAVRGRLPAARVTAVEPEPGRAAQLMAAGIADEVVASTLEDYLTQAVAEPYDLVIANPPFTLPGRREAWAEHLLAIAHHPRLLAAGAVVASVVPRIVMTGQSKRVRQLRSLMTFPAMQTQECPAGSFGAAVPTALIWFEAPTPTPVQGSLLEVTG